MKFKKIGNGISEWENVKLKGKLVKSSREQ